MPGLEGSRADEATKLYGDPAERPLADRRTGLISLGDSEISGEGVGTYEPGTDGPDNWCHRSPDAAIHLKARNTKIKTILLVIGANDDLDFSGVMTDCVTRFLLGQDA